MDSPARSAAFDAVTRTRRARADFEAAVEAGEFDLDGIFARAAADPVISTMKLLPLLEALPDVGKVSSRRALEAAGIAETARAGAVDTEQRGRLAEALAAGLGP